MAIINRGLFESIKDDLFNTDGEIVKLNDEYEVNVIQLNVRGSLAMTNLGDESGRNALLHWAAMCCVDDDMNPVFTVDDLMNMPNKMANNIIQAVIRVNGLLASAEKQDEIEKNSEEADS